ncbi:MULTISPECIES: type VII secretion protein EccB [Nocardioides]|uniref:Type VII secretion protein EccB n=1 Tax=Nocardioides vastitatis TaxID=2568655 RepID=A0ABW0ZGB5_9ACTN|nr:type VII secretion protein EccB [Nocardioides sp.]THJ07354.1 type VII secretion protein EccB [Nocardioides sp.]
MATKKDLVEAYAFSRRRLVTAFVSGAPGGREVEPARPGRMIVGGIAIAVLLLAGAAAAGALKPRPDVDWMREAGLVTDDRGALYINLEETDSPGQPLLRSVINVTSAQLILGSEAEAEKVPTEEIADQRKGPPIGILGAPATVPEADTLINSGWTSCTGTGLGIRTHVAANPQAEPTPRLGFVVRGADSGDAFLIAEADVPGLPTRAYRYPLPDNDALYAALQVSPTDEVTVPDPWLELFPPGGPLGARGLGIAGWGDRARVAGYPADALVGDWFTHSGRPFALTEAGAVELTPFAAAVLQSTSLGERLPRRLDVADSGTFTIDRAEPFAGAQWPEEVLDGSAGADEELCAVLQTAEDEEPAARLGVEPSESASAQGVPPTMSEATVASGHGAVVSSADWISDGGGTVHLIDDRGYSYPLAGQTEVDNLGYGGVPEVVVPHYWNKLFAVGPELSREAALCPPATAGEGRPRTCS